MKPIIFLFSLTLKGTLFYKDSIPLKNYKIEVIELDSTLAPLDSSIIETDDKGKFLFKGEKRGIFILKVRYKEATFRTDPLFEDMENISLSVYDTTKNSEHLFIARAHIAFVPSDGIIQVMEVYNFLNPFKKMVMKEFKLKLPENSSHIFSTQGVLPFETKIDSFNFIYERGFTPGTKTLSLVYHIPNQKVKYERKINFITNELLIMMPKEFNFKSNREFTKEEIDTPGGIYDVYIIKGLKKGEILKFELKKKGGLIFKEMIPPLILISGLIIFIILLRRRWRKGEVISG